MLEEHDINILLERLDLEAYRRLRQVQFFGSLAKVSGSATARNTVSLKFSREFMWRLNHCLQGSRKIDNEMRPDIQPIHTNVSHTKTCRSDNSLKVGFERLRSMRIPWFVCLHLSRFPTVAGTRL